MKKQIVLFLLAILAQTALAQIRISGTVTDAANQPLPAVVIKNVDAATKKMLGYTQTDSNGKFSVTAKVGSLLRISAMGYKEYVSTVKEGMGEQKIALADDAVSLNEITVKAKPVRIAGDTIKYLLSTYARPEDRTLADVLSRVPGFEVNKENGQISYEGLSISNFYIEGMNMLGGKYGLATKSLPQADVATVEVMKHHQPIRVLDDFTYSDDDAINIKMKKGAKEHWIATFSGGAGYESHGGLWNFEAFAMRLKPSWQTMITYKTNNTGKEIRSEMDQLISLEELNDQAQQFIQLPSPSTSKLRQRALMNRTHAFSLNSIRRIGENSQASFQVTYANDRREAASQHTSEYFVNSGNQIIDNTKYYIEQANELYAKMKFENNRGNHYLKNELSGDFLWDRQFQTERGTNPHDMTASVPAYTFKDNLSIIRRFGNKLITFESRNIMQVRPNALNVDSIRQDINQHYYETDTYVKGSFRLGRFVVSGNTGINATQYAFSSNLTGVPDSLGTQTGKSRFSLLRLYAAPEVEYKLSDLVFRLTGEIAYNHYKYSLADAYSRFVFSPELRIRWNVTSRWMLSADAGITTKQVDANQFYPTLVLQDYQYINRGLADYRVGHDKDLGININYSDAIHGTHLRYRVTRTFGNTPYTTSQHYVGDYIVISFLPQRTNNNAWNIELNASQSLGFLKGKLDLRAIYNTMNSELVQNGELMPFNTRVLNLTSGLTTGLIPCVDIDYNLSYMLNNMQMPMLGTASTINSWKHTAKVRVPLFKWMSFEALGEYYHNQIAEHLFKDIFFADLSMKVSTRRFDFALSLNNLLNKKNYAYSINSNFIRSYSNLNIRGRELMLNIYFKP